LELTDWWHHSPPEEQSLADFLGHTPEEHTEWVAGRSLMQEHFWLRRLLDGIRALVNQESMPGAGVPENYRKAWKKVYAVLRRTDDGTDEA
jgi:hypothetical protein